MPGAGGKRAWGVTANGVSLWGDKNVLELGNGAGVQLCEYITIHRIVHFKGRIKWCVNYVSIFYYHTIYIYCPFT